MQVSRISVGREGASGREGAKSSKGSPHICVRVVAVVFMDLMAADGSQLGCRSFRTPPAHSRGGDCFLLSEGSSSRPLFFLVDDCKERARRLLDS